MSKETSPKIHFMGDAEFEALSRYGFCVFKLGKHELPKIGEIVHLCFNKANKTPRCAVRLVAKQRETDGRYTCVYVAVVSAIMFE